jgi:hypothetical protein
MDIFLAGLVAGLGIGACIGFLAAMRARFLPDNQPADPPASAAVDDFVAIEPWNYQ